MKLEPAAIQTLLSTELNSLANNAGALASTGYDNANTSNLYIWASFELNVTFGSAPTAGSVCELYIIPAPDGTNYDDTVAAATAYAPSPALAGFFPLRNVTTAQKIPLGYGGMRNPITLPPTLFKLFLINKGGQAFPASGSTVKATLYRYQ